MHRNESRLQKLGVTPGRLLLIALLGVVLVVVIVVQYGTSEEASALAHARIDDRSARRPAEPSASNQSDRLVTNATLSPGRVPDWPTFTLEQVQRRDPFRFPDSLTPAVSSDQPSDLAQDAPEAETDARLARLKAIQAEGVAMVMITPKGPAATIGTTTVREGDTIKGFLVVKIDANGVTLSMLETD